MPNIPQDDPTVKFDTITFIVQYPSSGRYLRGPATIIEVRRNGGPGRPPTNPNLDHAIRWLAENGYQPDHSQFRYIEGDRPGVTTFRPRRQQVYRKEAPHESQQDQPPGG